MREWKKVKIGDNYDYFVKLALKTQYFEQKV